MNKIIRWLAYGSLIAAFVVGQLSNSKDKVIHSLNLTEGCTLVRMGIMDDVYATRHGDTLIGYLSCGQAQGYGGPLDVAVLSDTCGHIQNIELMHNVETHSFIEKLKTNHYFRQYKGKALKDSFIVHQDVNAVSGATISSGAIAHATRNASYTILEKGMFKAAPKVKKFWIFTSKECIALVLFVLGVSATFLKNRKLRYITLGLSLIFLGFMFNYAITLSHFGRILLGYFPDIHQHLVWWILMGGSLFTLVVWGRNVYCNALCPFHATQILLNKVSGVNLKFSMKSMRIIRKVPGFLVWLSLVLILVSSNPTLIGYEPFAMLFSLEGYGVQWYILPAALVASLFISDFFCHYLCPVGFTFRWIKKQRREVKSFFSKKQNAMEDGKQEHNKEKKIA